MLPEFRSFYERVRERIGGMADHAADVVLEAIVQKRDVRISYELLRDIGVFRGLHKLCNSPPNWR